MSVISGTVGAVTGASAAGDAAEAGATSAKYAADVQRYIYDTNRKDMMPFLEHAEALLPYDSHENAYRDTMRSGHIAAQDAFQDLWVQGPGSYEDSDWYKDTQKSIDYALEKANKEMGLASTVSGSQYGRDLVNYAVPLAAEKTREGRTNFVNEWINTKLNPLQQNINSLQGNTAAVNPAMNLIPSMQSNATSAGQGIADSIMSGGAAQMSGILGQQNALMQGLGGLSSGAGLAASLLLNPGSAAASAGGGGASSNLIRIGNGVGGGEAADYGLSGFKMW